MIPPASRSRSGLVGPRQSARDVDQPEQAEHDRRSSRHLTAPGPVAVRVAQGPPRHQQRAAPEPRSTSVPITLETPTRMPWPTAPGRPHQNSAPTTIAQPSRNSPTPSRRRAGSTSRAPEPTRRAAPPTACGEPAPDQLRQPRASGARGRLGRAAAATTWLAARCPLGRPPRAASDERQEVFLLPDDRGCVPWRDEPVVTRPRWGRRAGRHGREAT